MNKARRHELKMLKYKKRLEIIGLLSEKTLKNPKGVGNHDIPYNLTGYRNSGKPCSCYACQQPEDPYNRAQNKQRTYKELIEELSVDPFDESIEDDYWFRVNYDPGAVWLS